MRKLIKLLPYIIIFLGIVEIITMRQGNGFLTGKRFQVVTVEFIPIIFHEAGIGKLGIDLPTIPEKCSLSLLHDSWLRICPADEDKENEIIRRAASYPNPETEAICGIAGFQQNQRICFSIEYREIIQEELIKKLDFAADLTGFTEKTEKKASQPECQNNIEGSWCT